MEARRLEVFGEATLRRDRSGVRQMEHLGQDTDNWKYLSRETACFGRLYMSRVLQFPSVACSEAQSVMQL